jgi:hypothetical protein
MPQFRSRRSCRVAMSIPIRIYAVDYRGVDFTEDAETVVINRHGAKIRLVHQLLPDQEIRIHSRPTRLEAIFRVVSKVQGADLRYTYWGVENLDVHVNIWGVTLPALQAEDQVGIRAVLQCPTCAAQESIRMDEKLLCALTEQGGMVRGCPACNERGRWKIRSFQQL